MTIYCIEWQKLPRTLATRVDQKQVSDIVFGLKTEATEEPNASTGSLSSTHNHPSSYDGCKAELHFTSKAKPSGLGQRSSLNEIDNWTDLSY